MHISTKYIYLQPYHQIWELSSAGSEHPGESRDDHDSDCSFEIKYWELSSAGSEHLPYKQRVTGSNPVAPTMKKGFQK